MFTRDYLIGLCERAIVPHEAWADRDTPGAQEQVGQCWVYLKAGCKFNVRKEEIFGCGGCVCDENTIWLEIIHDTFSSLDGYGELGTTTIYLPTEKRLLAAEGGDWY